MERMLRETVAPNHWMKTEMKSHAEEGIELEEISWSAEMAAPEIVRTEGTNLPVKSTAEHSFAVATPAAISVAISVAAQIVAR
jgi:hypothetical protein